MTGLSKAVIRKWEDRYQTVTPARLSNGHRVYSERDIQILLAVRNLATQGMSIQQATIAVHQQSNDLQPINDQTSSHHVYEQYCLQLLEYGTSCDVPAIQRTLQEAHQKLGLDRFLDEVIIPLLWEIGERWVKNQWNPFQESVCSTLIRNYLVGLTHQIQAPPDAPLILGACLPGEIHDLPLCILLLKAQLRGYRVYLIASSPAPGSIEQLITYFKPSIVLLSAMSEWPFITYPQVLPALDEFASNYPDVRVFLGGTGAKQHMEQTKLQNIQYINRIEDIL